jgi:hypothetical protein
MQTENKNKGLAPIGMLEFWNIGIMGSGLRLGEDNGMVGLENQNEYNCIDSLVIVAYFLGRTQKMDV